MLLRRSRFAHLIPLGPDRFLLIHAVSHLRLLVNDEIARVLDHFDAPQGAPADDPALPARFGYSAETLAGCLAALMERGALTDKTPEAELEAVSELLGPSYGRDPDELLERYRRQAREGGEAYWASGAANTMRDFGAGRPRVEAVLLGDCDIHMEAEFLRREGAARGLDLRVAATFPDDVCFVAEHSHDVVLVGALRSRHAMTSPPQSARHIRPHEFYLAEAQAVLKGLREHTGAPILIDNLPEPTVQPLGLAERGLDGHRNRFRLANLGLADIAENFADVHVVDAAGALAAAGSERMIDDGQVGFTHLGSPGWMLQRPESEKAAVHGLFPDAASLAQLVDGDPYGREKVMAKTHVDALTTALGLDRKKCVVVDLDGTLWPGVLAETGAPFAWAPEVSGPFSYVGLYFGLHEALLCLKRRGVLLAAVSKNDEATVRELWRYPEHYPKERLLTPDDFVTWRVNWTDKVENVRSIADELGFALEAFLFIDDHPVERDRVRRRLPEVEVWGEDPFELRRRLLTDPRLQLPRITEEASARTDLVKAQLVRQQIRAEALSEQDYVASLDIRCRIEQPGADDNLERVEELFQRTTQFNATGRKFTSAELAGLLRDRRGTLLTLKVSDRFGDHGLVGAAVAVEGEIAGLAMSCRVLGMGVEHTFVRALVETLAPAHACLTARIVPTARNIPVRNIYRDNGFTQEADGLWRLRREAAGADLPQRLAAAS